MKKSQKMFECLKTPYPPPPAPAHKSLQKILTFGPQPTQNVCIQHQHNFAWCKAHDSWFSWQHCSICFSCPKIRSSHSDFTFSVFVLEWSNELVILLEIPLILGNKSKYVIMHFISNELLAPPIVGNFNFS